MKMTKQKELIKELIMALADEVAFSEWGGSGISNELLNRKEVLEILDKQELHQGMRTHLIEAGIRVSK